MAEKDSVEKDNDQIAINLVLDSKKESMDFYKDRFDRFAKYDIMYIEGAKKKNVPYGRANLKLPYAFQQVEPFVSQMMEATTGEKPYISYEGRNLNDEPNAELITEFTQYQMDMGGFVLEINKWFRSLAKYGTAVLKVVWDEEIIDVDEEGTEPQQVVDEQGIPILDEAGEISMEEVEVVNQEEVALHDGPTFFNLSLYDFFVPRAAADTNIRKMPWVIHRTYRSLEDLLLEPNYKQAHKEIKELIEAGNVDSRDKSSKKKNRRGIQSKQDEISQKYVDDAEILEWWGRYHFEDEDQNKDDEAPTTPPQHALLVVAVVKDKKILLRKEPNPLKYKFKPFIMANDYPIDGEPYGYGELDHIDGLITEGTALRNARLDVANLSINRIWIVLRTAGINIRNLFSAPNKIILTNDMAGIKPLDMQGVTAATVQEIARLDFDIQNTTEIINPRQDVSGVGGAFSDTATGVNFMSGRQNLRAAAKLQLLEDTFFRPLGLILNWYNRDLVSAEQNFKVTEDQNNPYRTVTAEQLATEVDYRAVSNPQRLTIQERKENMAYLLQTVAQIEGVKPGVNNFTELLREVYKISGFAHPEKYVNELPMRVIKTDDGQLVDEQGNPVEVISQEQAEEGGPTTGG